MTGNRISSKNRVETGNSMARRPARVWDEEGRRVSAGGPYGRRLAAMQQATERIGERDRERLAWVVQFAATEASDWDASTWLKHGDCLLVLAGGSVPANCLGGVRLPTPMPSGDVQVIHAELRAMLRDAVSMPMGSGLSIPAEGVDSGLVRASFVGHKPAVWASVYRSPSTRLMVLHAVKDLVLRAGDRLVKCRLCSTPIIAVRKQQFCTERCAQAFRNDKKAQRRAQQQRRRQETRRHVQTTRKG
jgi:hypothetical protein